MSITNPQTPASVAHQQIEALGKIVGTHDWHVNQWFDLLADYSNRYDNGETTNVCGTFRQWVNDAPNRKNVQKWRDFVSSLVVDLEPGSPILAGAPLPGEGQISRQLKERLLAHLDSILEKREPMVDGFKRLYSRTKSDWKVMRDISAASCFLNAFSQACNYGH